MTIKIEFPEISNSSKFLIHLFSNLNEIQKSFSLNCLLMKLDYSFLIMHF